MLHPGTIYKGTAFRGEAPIAVVAESRERLDAYLAAAPIGAWVWVRSLDDIPAEELGGVALLDPVPVDPVLRDALVAALVS
jgi:hypothetical protein